MAAEQKYIDKIELRRQRILLYLSDVSDHYRIGSGSLERGISQERFFQFTTDLLMMHRMDKSFFDSYENGLVALSLSQEMMLAAEDEQKVNRFHHAFNLFTEKRDYVDPQDFSHSAYVRENYSPTFVRKQPRNEVRRTALTLPNKETNAFAQIDNAHYKALEPNMIVNGNDVWQLAQKVARQLSLPEGRLKDISIAIFPPAVIDALQLGALTTGTKIAVTTVCTEDILYHELGHAIAGYDLARGYKIFFLKGVLEAITEMLLDNPFAYKLQRAVVEKILGNMPNKNFAKALEDAYIGDWDAIQPMWYELIKVYGLRAVAYFGLLSPGSSKFIKEEMGEENAKVFIPPQEALAFFEQPKAA